jgi:hypothetical protein
VTDWQVNCILTEFLFRYTFVNVSAKTLATTQISNRCRLAIVNVNNLLCFI